LTAGVLGDRESKRASIPKMDFGGGVEWARAYDCDYEVATGPKYRLGTVRTGWKVLRYSGCAMMRARKILRRVDVER
jgi:hypothetical protein